MTKLVRSTEPGFPGALFGDDLDNIFEGFFRPMRAASGPATGLLPAMDVTENDDSYIVKADLPGVKKKDIEVSISDSILTINAESKTDKESKDEGGRVIRRERSSGKYVRSMNLGTVVDPKRVKASYNEGVLELVLPKAEEAKPRTIAVDVH